MSRLFCVIVLVLTTLGVVQVESCGRYFKFRVTAERLGTGNGCTYPQMAELRLYEAGSYLAPGAIQSVQAFVGTTATVSSSPVGETIANLIDNNIGTKFLSYDADMTVKVTFPVSRCVSSYLYTTANDEPCRDPVTWIVSDSEDDITYVVRDSQTNVGGSITTLRQSDAPLFSYSNTHAPTVTPTSSPTKSPTTSQPSASPTTSQPTTSPVTSSPSTSPTTSTPTSSPTMQPTVSPTTSTPTSSPTTSTPSVAPSFVPTQSPTTSMPTQSPTLRAPALLYSILSDDLRTISVAFDMPTNLGVFQTPRVCSPEIAIESSDTGCAGVPCPMLCQFLNSTTLVITLNSQSNMNKVPTVTVLPSAGIAQVNVMPDRFADVSQGTLEVSDPIFPLIPTVSVLGPSLVSLCSRSPLTFLSQSTGGGGRPLALQWFVGPDLVKGATSNTFKPDIPSDPALIPYSLLARNWFGEIATSTLIVNYTSQATCAVSLTVPSNLDPGSAMDLTFEALASVASDCLPLGYNASSIKLSYDWQITPTTGEGSPLNVSSLDPIGSKTSKLRISPVALLTPGNSFAISVRVSTGIPGLTGAASAIINVPKASPIARIANGSTVTTDSIARLNAGASCDPNFPVPVCKTQLGGQIAANVSGLKSITWFCLTSDNQPCFGTEQADVVYCQNLAVCDLNVTDIPNAETRGPFTIKALVESATSLDASWSNSVQVLYQPQQLDCPYPKLMTSCSCNSKQIINVDDDLKLSAISVMPVSWAQLPASVPKIQTIQWSYLLDNGTFVSIGDTVDPGRVLVLNPTVGFSMLAGRTYTFRATSYQRCGVEPLIQSDVYSEVTFTANGPPTGGSLEVGPSSGNISTIFVMNCDGFVDADLPLQYSFAYWQADRNVWQTLGSGFSDLTLLLTRLPVNATGHNIMCRARDSYQAVSKLDQAPRVSGIIVEVPSAVEVLNAAQNLESDLTNALAGGTSTKELLSVIAIAASNVQQLLLANASQSEKDNFRGFLLGGLSLLVNQDGPPPSGAQSEQLLNTLSNVIGADMVNVSDPKGTQVLQQAASVLSSALDAIKTSQQSDDGTGEQADTGKVADSTTGLLGTIVSSVKSSAPIPPSTDATRAPMRAPVHRGRRLESSAVAQQETIIQTTRKALRNLADVLLANMLEGEQPFVIPAGVDIKVVGAVATPNAIGDSSSVQELVIPAFNESDPPSVFYLPRNVLANATNDTETRVNIVAVRFRFNIREMLTTGLVNYTLDPLAPVNRVEEVLALDFQRPVGSEQYHPKDLSEPIRIKVPLTYDQLPKTNDTQLACGYWDEVASRWSSYGCNLTDFQLPASPDDKTGWLMCSCNHASDYAAWKAFVEDITAVFNDPLDLTRLTTIAAVVCGVLLPAITVFWLLAARIGRKRDLRDSRKVHLGTFVVITRRKLQLHDRQRRFFKILRENKGISAKQLVQLQHQQEEAAQKRHSELNNATGEGEEGKDYYLKAVVLRVLRSLTLTNALAGGLFIAGAVVRSFYPSSQLSLTNLASSPKVDHAMFAAIQALVGVSVLLCFSTTLVCLVLLFKQGRVTNEFKLLFATSTMACAIATAAFALPIVHASAHGGTSGSGLGLIIAGGALTIANFVTSLIIWFIRAHQEASKSIFLDFLADCGRGLIYEQSIISIFTRFDPYLDREKRFSLFVAILIGNLFAGSFFFSLKTAQEVSLGLMIGTIILCAFVVAIPVKLTIRFLFKVTAARRGSAMDRVAQIFRIVAFTNDVHPAFANEAQKLDVELLHAFKKFYMAKHQVNLLEEAYDKQRKMEDDLAHMAHGLPPKGTYEYYLPLLLNGDIFLQTAAVAMFLAGLSVDFFAVDQSGMNIHDPTASDLAIVFVVFALLLIVVQIYLVVLGKRRAPTLFKVLMALHVIAGAFALAAFIAPLATYASLLTGLELFIAAGVTSILGQLAFVGALYIYYWCEPSIKSIHRFLRGPTAVAAEGVSDHHDDEENQAASSSASPVRIHSKRVISTQRDRSSTGGIVDTTADMGSLNPIARKEVSNAMRSHAEVDRRTGEFEVDRPSDGGDLARPRTDTLSKAMSTRLDSKRFISNTHKLEMITRHEFLEKALQKSADGKITLEIMHLARAHLEQAKKELKNISELSRLAWFKQNPLSLSAKQMVVRREKTVMLKLATVLSEETAPRPKPVKRWIPEKLTLLAWSTLLAYYVGCLIWIAFWIFSRDAQSKQRLIESGVDEPTNEQVATTTNTVLLAWLGGTFLSMFTSYFIAEPLLIVFRYGILPLLLRLSRGQPKPVPEQLVLTNDAEHGGETADETTWRAKVWMFLCSKKRTAEMQEREAAFLGAVFDGLSDFIEAVS